MSARWCLLLVMISAVAAADERILDYHSDILVRADGFIEVTETIRVRAEGQQIRRGIYRDYPTDYKDSFGNDYNVVYEPLSVIRNGEAEPFHSDEYRNGVRTYFGSSDRLLDPGEHVYVYRYEAGRMLGFFADHDELWWNVTGNGWAFPIDRASASVAFEFDPPAEALSVDAWQGILGSREKAGAAMNQEGAPVFSATRPLGANEGLTISIQWPKGYVAEPTDMQRLAWLLSDNVNLLVALGGLALLFAYYVPVWSRYGRDPDPGVIFTRYEPPDGYSPASLRYIENMGYDTEVMTAGVVSLAVKGYLEILDDDDEHVLARRDPGTAAAPLAAGEKALLDGLFGQSDRVRLVNENHSVIGGARKAHRKSLKRDYHRRYFQTNGLLNLPPLLTAIVASVVAIRINVSPMVLVTVAAMVGTIVFFAIVLKRPTGMGRKLLDQSAGFREYLEIAEKDELNLMNPPDKTPELFERYLPFALALGVEQQWAKRFTQVFAALGGPDGGTWHPAWYHGSWDSRDLGGSLSQVSSGLTSSISSSATPPGSSSSGGGGGFSGGGGGGGGGGGW